ncbi:hypothetical protein OROMI_007871 [Orobanche minor]
MEPINCDGSDILIHNPWFRNWLPFRNRYIGPTFNELNLIEKFLPEFALEAEDFDPKEVVDWSKFQARNNCEDLRAKVVKFLDQVRESKGYDVDVVIDFSVIENWKKYNVFTPLDMSNEEHLNLATEAASFVVSELNKLWEAGFLVAAMSSKYVLEDVEKTVRTDQNVLLLTFTAKQVATGKVDTLQAMVSQGNKLIMEEFKLKVV